MRMESGLLTWVQINGERFNNVNCLYAEMQSLDISIYNSGIICANLMARADILLDYSRGRIAFRRTSPAAAAERAEAASTPGTPRERAAAARRVVGGGATPAAAAAQQTAAGASAEAGGAGEGAVRVSADGAAAAACVEASTRLDPGAAPSVPSSPPAADGDCVAVDRAATVAGLPRNPQASRQISPSLLPAAVRGTGAVRRGRPKGVRSLALETAAAAGLVRGGSKDSDKQLAALPRTRKSVTKSAEIGSGELGEGI